MDEATVAINWILGVVGAITVLIGGVKAISSLFDPQRKFRHEVNTRLTNLEDKTAKHDRLFENDLKRLNSNEETNKILCRCMLALLDAQLSGEKSGIEKAKKELQAFIIEK